jgi:putative intracellular protease/amidase
MGAPRAAHRTARLVAVFALCVCTASTMLAATRSVHGDNAAPAPIVLDVEAVLRGVNFDLATTDGNGGTGHAATGNGLLDAAEMAVIAAVLSDTHYDRSTFGGASHAATRAAYAQARAAALADQASLLRRYPTAADLVVGYVLIGTPESRAAIEHMVGMFGAPLQGDYALARGLGRWFGPDGDADGDGVTNRTEYAETIADGVPAYVAAALDPTVRPAAASSAPSAAVATPAARRKVGIVLYPGFEVLDVYGPAEMWGYVPEFDVVYIAEQAGPVMSGQGVATVAQFGFADAPPLDILMVPGGFGTMAQLGNAALIAYLRAQDARSELTTSVCTGSALLARAGVLDGRRATSNKRFFSLAAAQDADVDWVVSARWVEDGKYVTSSGVSAGTDMALAVIARLFGRARAEGIASGVEYEWQDDPSVDPFARYADWPAR